MLPGQSPREDDLVPLLKLLPEPRDHLGWLLEIAVEDHGRPAPTLTQARGNRLMLTEIATEANGSHVGRIPPSQRRHHEPRIIGTTIVHEHDLIVQSEGLGGLGDAVVERFQAAFAPIDGTDDAEVDHGPVDRRKDPPDWSDAVA